MAVTLHVIEYMDIFRSTWKITSQLHVLCATCFDQVRLGFPLLHSVFYISFFVSEIPLPGRKSTTPIVNIPRPTEADNALIADTTYMSRTLFLIVHASGCKDPMCNVKFCSEYRTKVVEHVQVEHNRDICKETIPAIPFVATKGQTPAPVVNSCKWISSLCEHWNICMKEECPPLCIPTMEIQKYYAKFKTLPPSFQLIKQSTSANSLSSMPVPSNVNNKYKSQMITTPGVHPNNQVKSNIVSDGKKKEVQMFESASLQRVMSDICAGNGVRFPEGSKIVELMRVAVHLFLEGLSKRFEVILTCLF